MHRFIILVVAMVLIVLTGGLPAALAGETVTSLEDLDVRLAGCGYVDGREVLFVVYQPDVGYGKFTPYQTVLAVDRTNGEPVKTMLTRDRVLEMYPEAKEWRVFDVDRKSRIYLQVVGVGVVVIEDNSEIARFEGWKDSYIPEAMAFDGGIVTGNRYLVQHLRLNVLQSRYTPDPMLFNLNLPYKTHWDPPGAEVSVSPDGELIYISSSFEAYAWDRKGNLRFDLGTVYPNSGNVFGLPDGFDREPLYGMYGIYFQGPYGHFDPLNRLWLYYQHQMWAVNERGQILTRRFELHKDDGTLVKSSPRYCFPEDGDNLYVLDWDDGLVYVYDITPTLELEQSELDDQFYPVGNPPLLLRSFSPIQIQAAIAD